MGEAAMNTRLMRIGVYARIAVSTAIPAWPQEEIAPKHEVGLTLSGFFTTDRPVRRTPVELGTRRRFAPNRDE